VGEAPPERHPRRFLRIGCLVVAVVALAAASVYVIHGRKVAARAAGEVAERCGAVEREWQGRRGDRPVIFGGDAVDGNAAELYLQAVEGLGRIGEKKSTAAYGMMASRWPQKPQRLRAVEAELRWSRPGRALVDRGLSLKTCDFAAELGDDRTSGAREFARRLPEIEHSLMYLGRMTGVEVNRLQALGRSDEAAEVCLMGLAFAGDLGRGGGVRAIALSLGLEHDLSGALVTLVVGGRLTSRGYASVAGKLLEIDRSRATVADAFRAERAVFCEWARRTAGGLGFVPKPVELDRDVLGSAPIGTTQALSAGALAERWEKIDEWYGRTIELAGERPLELRSEWPLMGLALGRLRLDPIVAVATRAVPQAVDNAVEARVTRRGLAICAALMRWQAGKGAFPEDLSQMVPEYLAELPIDPASGKSFVYRPPQGDEKGDMLLYSVGLDGKDDGGKLPFMPEKGTAFGGDILFRLKGRAQSKSP